MMNERRTAVGRQEPGAGMHQELERARTPKDREQGTRPVGGRDALYLVGFCQQYVAGAERPLRAPRPYSPALLLTRAKHERGAKHIGELRALA